MNNDFLDIGDQIDRNELKRLRNAERYKKFWYAFIVGTFCAFIFGGLIMRLILPTPTVSIAENRELKKMPPSNAGNIFFGKFTTDFENFFSDTFPLRDDLLSAGNYFSYLSRIPIAGVDSVVVMDNKIMQGDEDVPSGTDNRPQVSSPAADAPASSPSVSGGSEQDFEETTGEDETKSRYLMTDTAIYKETKTDADTNIEWTKGINRLHQALPGKRIIVMSPPSSYAFYADKKYSTPKNDQKTGLEDMYNTLDPGIYKANPYPYLEKLKDEYIFFRTDHHWTALGAYCGYTAFCSALGIEPVKIDSMKKETYERDFLGSYYKQLQETAKARLIEQHPDKIDYYVPKVNYKVTVYDDEILKNGTSAPMFDLDKVNLDADVTNCYLIFFGGDYPGIKITTDTKNGKSIVILKDSFANSLAPFLTANYQYIYMVDFRKYNLQDRQDFSLAKFVKDNNIDDVLLLMSFDLANNPTYEEWYLAALP